MKLLLIHGDLKYRVKKRVKVSVVENAGMEWKSFENALVVFTCIEKEDVNKEGMVDQAASEIAIVADRVKAKSVVLYPYAHLSTNLAPPFSAVSILKGVEEGLKAKGYKVARTPFGWYKEFQLHNFGHALAESFRSL